jgi:predicted transcriptional regulator
MYTKSKLFTFRELVLGNSNPIITSKNINKNKSQVYKILNSLIKKNMVYKDKLGYKLENHKFVFILSNIIKTSPKIINYLSDSKLLILLNLISYTTIKEICRKTDLSKVYVSKFIKSAYYSSILLKNKNKYSINKIHWSELISFLYEYNTFYNTFDSR